MAKAKQNEIEEIENLTDEEKAALEALESGDDDRPILPYLKINTAPVDDDGNDIPVQTFNIAGSKVYKKTVKFRPIEYVSRLLDMRQDSSGNWKTVNETIYFKRNEEAIDAAGGVGCGRLLGKATLNMTEEQKKANKSKAQFYGYLFGIVTIDGEEPKVVSFRLPAGKAMKVGNALQQIRKAGRKIHQVELTLKLVPNKDKKNINPDIEVEFNPDNILPTTKVLAQATMEIQNFIKKNNEAVRQSHFSAAKQRQDNTTASKVVNKILNKAVEESDEEEIELDDEIPF